MIIKSTAERTEERIRNLTIEDTKKIFASLTDSDYELMRKSFISLDFHKARYILEIAVWREMQGDITCTQINKD